MTREEIVTALRCHCDAIGTGKCPKDKCPSFERPARYKCAGVVSGEAVDLIEKLAADCKALINELCQYCGKYKYAHEGACDGCKWRDM